MKTAQYKSLGLNLNISVPETVDEFDTLAGQVGAALNFAVSHEVAHGTLGEFRSAFATALEKETGIARPFHTVPAKTPTGKPTEVWGTAEGKVRTEEEYVKMVLASNGKKIEDYQSLADSVMASITFDPKKKVRTGTGPALAQRYLQAADQIISKGAGAKVLAKLTKRTDADSLDPAALRIALAHAIKADQESKDLSSQYAK